MDLHIHAPFEVLVVCPQACTMWAAVVQHGTPYNMYVNVCVLRHVVGGVAMEI